MHALIYLYTRVFVGDACACAVEHRDAAATPACPGGSTINGTTNCTAVGWPGLPAHDPAVSIQYQPQ
eukprot:SAG11_NODE_30422_length_301_cov_0.752475_1_plen_66_part_10